MTKSGPPRSPFAGLTKTPPIVWLFLFCASVFLVTIPNLRPNIDQIVSITQELHVDNKSLQGYLIRTDGCRIPDLPIRSEKIEKYFGYSYGGAHCNHDLPPLVDSNLTSIYVLEKSLKSYNITDTSIFNCCYEELFRKIPKNGQSDDQYEYGPICTDFGNATDISMEFIHVKCNYSGNTIYEDFFAFVPKKNVTTDNAKINVLVIGIDGVSRLNFHRQMPKTAEILNELKFNEFYGYNKIADNTYPNLITVLTGHDEDTIASTCKKHGKYYDNCTYIWDHFKKKDYVTSFAEDSAWMGMFNYQKYGFRHQPTDYMWGFFDRIAEKLAGNSKSLNVIQCIGPREVYKMFVNYIDNYVTSMKMWELPYFAFFWSSSLSHDFLNKPRIGDEIYANLLRKLHDNAMFENTVVVFMSDHGIRWGAFRETYQGRIEERLPLFYVRLPVTFTLKYPLATDNLRYNTRQLVTPYDLHETLYELTVPLNLRDSHIQNERFKAKTNYGISLFRKINRDRTCKSAGIADHWCTCMQSSPVEITEKITRIAQFAVDHLNKLLAGYAQCATLTLRTVLNAQLLTHVKKESEADVADFQLGFVTIPGNGTFETTVRLTGNDKMEILGTVSRLNLYGKQSLCITDFHLKLYCYCKKNVWD